MTEITLKQYAEKILDVAYYDFPMVHPKETVLNVIEALLLEFTSIEKVKLEKELHTELHTERDMHHLSENQQWQDKYNDLYKSICEVKEYGQFNSITASKLNGIITKAKKSVTDYQSEHLHNYFDDLEACGNNFYCNTCGCDKITDFTYSTTNANGIVYNCKHCKTEIIVKHKPKEDMY